ncbi:glycerol-3-phosphate dehydrogenase/oxidase [Alicyclobacillus fastidiosus]|uniref:Aerobic glycerol-3-phosphate dehydrogenase n=2 Tax=Alicyclobacillus fastidiosus TaxID=392011 RepID=A0ABY6ZR89_9BACL|nr:FAD-dependent oxidoreductase [Alicyclobacillus fastidiosus]WAH44636.1 glycerol-3-phosphate dehydrogenase/oxidase [Alicyclobacillus fastidiosus]
MRTRSEMANQLQNTELDVLVIGGGITGAGILLDAQVRGMSCAMVEMQDFAAGTSNRSTKLVHGGLRYLKQFEVGLVAEVGKERAIVYENGPHITTPLWMLLPIVKGGTYGRVASSLGTFVYDRLAGVKRSERRKMLNCVETLGKEPLLRRDGLKGAGYYVEYRTDDARLTLEIIKEAVARGAMALNYTKVTELLYRENRVVGAVVTDVLHNKTYEVRAKKVVNATGPWVDFIRSLDGSKVGKTLHHTKGVHIVVDGRRFPLQNAVYFDVPDGRMVFAIPREGKTYIGTTDTNYQGDLICPRMTEADRNYLIECVNFMFPTVQLAADDVESSWAGIRPLIHEEGKHPSEISRRDEVFRSDSGLFTIAGGKLTGYRKMADKVVTMVAAELSEETGRTFGACTTEHLEYSGGKFGGAKHLASFLEEKTQEGIQLGLAPGEASRLARRYGTNVQTVYDIIRSRGEEARERGLSREVFAALVYGLEYEAVASPSDFFIRRTGSLYFDIHWLSRWQDPVIDAMSTWLQWTPEARTSFQAELEARVTDATQAV